MRELHRLHTLFAQLEPESPRGRQGFEPKRRVILLPVFRHGPNASLSELWSYMDPASRNMVLDERERVRNSPFYGDTPLPVSRRVSQDSVTRELASLLTRVPPPAHILDHVERMGRVVARARRAYTHTEQEAWREMVAHQLVYHAFPYIDPTQAREVAFAATRLSAPHEMPSLTMTGITQYQARWGVGGEKKEQKRKRRVIRYNTRIQRFDTQSNRLNNIDKLKDWIIKYKTMKSRKEHVGEVEKLGRLAEVFSVAQSASAVSETTDRTKPFLTHGQLCTMVAHERATAIEKGWKPTRWSRNGHEAISRSTGASVVSEWPQLIEDRWRDAWLQREHKDAFINLLGEFFSGAQADMFVGRTLRMARQREHSAHTADFLQEALLQYINGPWREAHKDTREFDRVWPANIAKTWRQMGFPGVERLGFVFEKLPHE